jgi:hypothetical protein
VKLGTGGPYYLSSVPSPLGGGSSQFAEVRPVAEKPDYMPYRAMPAPSDARNRWGVQFLGYI